jgi:LysM repeat protein
VVHVVTAADTLSAIARRFGTSVAALAADNDLTDPDRIFEGQTLVLGGSASAAPVGPVEPTRTEHTVAPGDTLSRIAAAHGLTVADLAAANDIDNVDRIVVGQVLQVPTGATAPEEPAPEPPPVTMTTTLAPTPTTTAPPPEETTVRFVDDVLLMPVFSRWSDVYRVPQDLLEAIAWKESNWRPDAVGPGGHLGIMQCSPATVELIETGMLGRTVEPSTRSMRKMRSRWARATRATCSIARKVSERRSPPGIRG